nr:helix-turn-helix transcriptional regulator [uncultured Flavobacterium sp.]
MRKQEKLTQYDLASELDLSPITISKLENGENTTLETVLKSYNILMKSITLINLFKVK